MFFSHSFNNTVKNITSLAQIRKIKKVGPITIFKISNKVILHKVFERSYFDYFRFTF